MESLVNFGLYATYLLVVVATTAVIIFPILQAVGNPGVLVKSLIGIAALLLIFGIGWIISGSEVTELYQKYGITAGGSKLVGGALIMLYILGILSVVSIAYSEVSKLLK